CPAAGLQYNRWPAWSTVTIPVGTLRSTSAASSRACRSSPASASRSAPITDTRLAKYAVTNATPTKTSSCNATCPVMGVVWPKNTSAKYTMPTSAVISAVLAGGISTAVTAIKGTYNGVRSLCGPPVMWTTVVISATSYSAWAYRNVRPGARPRMWVYQYEAMVTTTVATRRNDVTRRSSGAAKVRFNAALT